MSVNVGNNLKSIIKLIGSSQDKFARDNDISAPTLSKYISGGINISLDFLLKISDKYNLSLDMLVFGSVDHIPVTREDLSSKDKEILSKVDELLELNSAVLDRLNRDIVKDLISDAENTLKAPCNCCSQN